MSLSGPSGPLRPRRIRRGAALTVLFATVLAAAAATDVLPQQDPADDPRGPGTAVRTPAASAAPGDRAVRDEVVRAAAEALADGRSGRAQAAEEVVSRSGDRWGAVYEAGEYAEFERALGGAYTGVGLRARRTAEGQGRGDPRPARRPRRPGRDPPGRPAAHHRRPHRGRPDRARVAALLRGDGIGRRRHPGGGGHPVVLGLQRGERTWTRTLRRAELAAEAVAVHRLDGDAVLVRVTAFTRAAASGCGARWPRPRPGRASSSICAATAAGWSREAVAAASAFLDGGLVATYDVHGEERALYADPGATPPDPWWWSSTAAP